MQVHAITKNVRMSAQKMREVVRQIQGLPAAAGAGSPGGRAAQRRAVRGQDAEVGHRQRRGPEGAQAGIRDMNTDALRIKEAVAQTATTLKRFTPKARGSAGPILKRNCHVKIVLSDE